MLTSSGLFIINKPSGISSYDVIRELKHKFNTTKFGHSGTLDPLASGVLVVGVNRGTKLFPLIDEKFKTYRAGVKLGVRTDTLDITGEVVEKGSIPELTPEQIKSVLTSFLGKQEQIPPQFSAKKVGGKKAYELARAGKIVELKPNQIIIQEITFLNNDNSGFSFEVTVSKGTYIRSLIADICEKLGCLGTMESLERISSDGFDLTQAKTIDELSSQDLIVLGDYLKSKYPSKITKSNIIKNGGKIKIEKDSFPLLFLDEQENPIGLYAQIDQSEYAKPILMI